MLDYACKAVVTPSGGPTRVQIDITLSVKLTLILTQADKNVICVHNLGEIEKQSVFKTRAVNKEKCWEHENSISNV